MYNFNIKQKLIPFFWEEFLEPTLSMHFKDLLEFIKDGDSYVQMEYAEFYGKLKESDQTGENSEDAEVCETRYECPLTGEEMAEMMKSQFEGDDE